MTSRRWGAKNTEQQRALSRCWQVVDKERAGFPCKKKWKSLFGCRTRRGDDSRRALPTLLPEISKRAENPAPHQREACFNKSSVRPHQNIFAFAFSRRENLTVIAAGELFGPGPGVWDAWLTAIQAHWRNCFPDFVYLSFFVFIPHWQEQVYSDTGCTNRAGRPSALTLMPCLIFPRLLSTRALGEAFLHHQSCYEQTNNLFKGPTLFFFYQ